jgi:hypothetical protein
MARRMNFKRYIPDHAVTTVPVLALLFAVHYFLLSGEPDDPGIEIVDVAPLLYENGQRIG